MSRIMQIPLRMLQNMEDEWFEVQKGANVTGTTKSLGSNLLQIPFKYEAKG